MLSVPQIGLMQNLMNNKNNNSFLDALTLLSVMLQVVGYQNDITQSSNDDIMKALQKQNKAYLEKIIETQYEILDKLANLV